MIPLFRDKLEILLHLSMGSTSNLNKLSRPLRNLHAIPTNSNTRRCFAIACRVSFEFSVIDSIRSYTESKRLSSRMLENDPFQDMELIVEPGHDLTGFRSVLKQNLNPLPLDSNKSCQTS